MNNYCPNKRTRICDHDLMSTKPWYILSNVSNLDTFGTVHCHYSQVAFGLSNQYKPIFYLINYTFLCQTNNLLVFTQ